jgi:hypothetical protein
LAHIAAATGLANQHHQDVMVQEALTQQDKTLSPIGLVESTKNDNLFDDEEDRPMEMDYPDLVPPSLSQDSGVSPESYQSNDPPGGEPTKEEETELRRTVQALFELEEALLNQHMSNIQEHAEMLTQEGKLLQTVQANGLSEEDMDNYAIQLADYLDRKEVLIYKLQSKLVEFQKQLAKEQRLAQRVTKLTQY